MPPSLLSESKVYERPAPRGAQLVLTVLWLGCLLGPWFLIALTLSLKGPFSGERAWRQVSRFARGYFVTEPFAHEALIANLVAVVLLLAGFFFWRWRRAGASPRAAVPLSESLLLPFFSLVPALALVGFHSIRLGPKLLGAMEAGGSGSPMGGYAATGTTLGVFALVSALPLIAIVVLRRRLQGRSGSCEVGSDQVVFSRPGFAPYRIALSKSDLAAREVTEHGVLIEVPSGGRFLIPAEGEVAAGEVVAALDNLDLSVDRSIETAGTLRRTRLVRAGLMFGIALQIGLPLAFATYSLGLAWVLPALVGILAIEALAFRAQARWWLTRADPGRIHLGRDGLLAQRLIPYGEIKEACTTATGLAFLAGGEPHFLSLGTEASRARDLLAERVGEISDAPRLWATPSRRRRSQLGFALITLALAGFALWVAKGPFPLYEVVARRDTLGNAATQVIQLGAPERLLFLGPLPERVRLSVFQEERLAEGVPGLVLDVGGGEVLQGGKLVGEIPAGTRLAVLGGTPRALECSPRAPLSAWLRMLVWHKQAEDTVLFSIPEYLSEGLVFADGDPVWQRYLAGATSAHFLRQSDPRGETLGWFAEQGRVRWVFTGPGVTYDLLTCFFLDAGEVSLVFKPGSLNLSSILTWGWQPGDPGRLLWLGAKVRSERAALAFPGSLPSFERLQELSSLVAGGQTWEGAAGKELPYWRLPRAFGLSRETLREVALARRRPKGQFGFRTQPGAVCEAEFKAYLGGLDLSGEHASLTVEKNNVFVVGLLESLQSPVPRTRLESIQAIEGLAGATVNREVYDHVLRALRDPSPEVRRAAALATRNCWLEPEKVLELKRHFETEKSPQVRLAIVDAPQTSLNFVPDLVGHLELIELGVQDDAEEVRAHARVGLRVELKHRLKEDREWGPGELAKVAQALRGISSAILKSEKVNGKGSICAQCQRKAPPSEAAVLELVWTWLDENKELRLSSRQEIAAARQRAREPAVRTLAAKTYRRVELDCTCSGANSLCWLKRNQESDGRWASPRGERDLEVSALALLVFLGNGHTHRFGTYKRQVERGLDWIQEQQRPEGSFGERRAPGLAQAMGAWVLSEAFAVSRDQDLKPLATRALEHLLQLQNPDGGWSDGSKGTASTTLATGYAVLALKAARTAGVDLPGSLKFDDPKSAFMRVRSFLRAQGNAKGNVSGGHGELLDLPGDASESLVPLPSAVAVISRIFTGERRTALVAETKPLVDLLPQQDQASPTYWYFGTYALFQFGGKGWKAWNKAMQNALLPTQRGFGHREFGSWDPAGIWGAWGGRAGTTALNALTLEIYYRYERAQGH